MIFLLNDRSGELPEKSDIINDCKRIMENGIIEQEEISAYVFNYDLVISPKDDFNIDEAFISLKKDIGENLFNQLSYDDKLLMIKTAGIIDFGHPIDLDNILKESEKE